MDKIITLAERRLLQFELLKEFDRFCREHSIRYSLAYGTLLGAVRHKGYIPWDDDIDIIIPWDELCRFKKLYHSSVYKLCDVDTEKNFDFAFSRFCNQKTYRKSGIKSKAYGVNIDIYPIIGIPSIMTEIQIKRYLNQCIRIRDIRLIFMRVRSFLLRKLPLKNLSIHSTWVRMYRQKLLSVHSSQNVRYYMCIDDPNFDRFYEFDLFKDVIELSFEGHKFLACKEYDSYLRLSYGDYMQLPPEKERIPYHGGTYYWLNK